MTGFSSGAAGGLGLRPPSPPRWVGGLPIFFDLYCTVYCFLEGRAGDLFWLCYAVNLTMGIGILAGWPRWIWVSTLWIVLSTPLWVWDITRDPAFLTPHAFAVHVVTSGIGLYWIGKGWAPSRGGNWWRGVLLCIFMWGLARAFTDPKLNVNVAWDVYAPLKSQYDAYWKYWVANTVFFSLLLFAFEKVLLKYGQGRLARVSGSGPGPASAALF